MARVHPTARIHPSAILEGDVSVGPDTVIDPFVYIEGPVKIGARNHIHPSCVIGKGPEHRRASGGGQIIVGDDNIVRELTVITRGTGERDTQIGSGCYLMDHVHISHDVLVEDGATLSHNVVLAGHVTVLQGATLGMSAVVHQHSVIGAYAMVGMGAVVTRDVPPFCLVRGNPARFARLNSHALPRAGIAAGDLSVRDGQLHSESPAVQTLIDAALSRFVVLSRRPVMPLHLPARRPG